VERICDTFTVLRRGRVVWDGTARELRAQAPPPSFLLMTSDDAHAAAMARRVDGLACSPLETGGLEVSAGESALDTLVLALARSDIAVRRLEESVSALEAMFFTLTEQPEDSPVAASTTLERAAES
jgi:ABC-2 type transport system ATP-binding protein